MSEIRARSSYSNTPAKMPALPTVRVDDPALQRFLDAVRESLEVRNGARGDGFERAATMRDLIHLGLLDERTVQSIGRAGAPSAQEAGAVLVSTGTGFKSLGFEAFTKAITDSRLFKSLMQKLDDPTRFDSLPAQVASILRKDIAKEAAIRGAAIQRVEQKIQEAEVSAAIAVQEVTAALGSSVAGVRETTFATATKTEATAGVVTQIRAAVGDPASFTGAGVTLEQTMFGIASLDQGLYGQYTMKIDANGHVAGFGLAVEATGANDATSAFIVAADKFAIVDASDTFVDPLNPDANRIPFGVDTVNDTIYINGSVRINAGGSTLDSLGAGESVAIVYAYKRSATLPVTDPGTKTYSFSTHAFTAALDNGWTETIPAGSDPLYVVVATAASTTATVSITAAEWTDPVLLVQDGAAAAAGLNAGTIRIYQRTGSSTPPTVGGTSPTNDLTYTFSTGGVAGTPPSGWSLSVPLSGGGYLWEAIGTAAAAAATDVVPPADLSSARLIAVDGADGADGADAVADWVLSSTNVITRKKDGTYSPNALDFDFLDMTGGSVSRFYTYNKATGATAYTWGGAPITGSGTGYSGQTNLASALDDTNTAVRIQVYYDAGRTMLVDQIVIPIVNEGSDSLTPVVSNGSHTVPSSSGGAVSDYSGSGTTIQILEGAAPLQFNTTIGVGKFTIGTPVVSPTGDITVGARSGSGTTTATVANHSAMDVATDVVTITYPITVRKLDGTDVSLSMVQTITKAKAGATGATGGTGATGSAGTRGTRQLYDTDNGAGANGYNSLTTYDWDGAGGVAAGSASYIARANELIAAATSGSTPTTPIKGDTVTFTNGTNFTNTLTYNGSAWVNPGVVIDGSLLVTGSVTATKLEAGSITATQISSTPEYNADGVSFSLGAGAAVNGYDGAVAALSNDGGRWAILAANTANVSGAGGIGVGVLNGSSYAGAFVNSTDDLFNVHRTSVQLASNERAGWFVNTVGPSYTAVQSEVYLGELQYAVQIKVGMFRIDQAPTTTSGGGAITYATNAPTGTPARSAAWVKMNFNGTDYWVPCVQV